MTEFEAYCAAKQAIICLKVIANDLSRVGLSVGEEMRSYVDELVEAISVLEKAQAEHVRLSVTRADES
jgi:hypothetical protein